MLENVKEIARKLASFPVSERNRDVHTHCVLTAKKTGQRSRGGLGQPPRFLSGFKFG
jgi:hypothetical protein